MKIGPKVWGKYKNSTPKHESLTTGETRHHEKYPAHAVPESMQV